MGFPPISATRFCVKNISWPKNWCFGKKKTFFGHYILFGPFLAIFIHFNSIWCKNPISALLGEIFAGSILWNFHKGKDEYCQFPQIFWQTKSARGWYLNLMEKIPQGSNWRARQLKIGSYSTKLQWVTKSTWENKIDCTLHKIPFAFWWNLGIVIWQSLWRICGFPTCSRFNITMSPELWDSSLSLFINLAYSWHGLRWGLGTLSLFWMVQKPCKITKLPWKITEQNMTMKIPWKIMEQTIIMKSHKGNLTKKRKQRKTKKTMQQRETILKSMETSKKPWSYFKRPWEP